LEYPKVDKSPPYISLLLILILLGLSAFFSGSETALMSLRKMRLKHLVQVGNKKAQLVDKLLKKTDHLLGTILVGNNLANVAASVLSGALASQMLEPAFGKEVAMFVATLIMTFLLLIFSEITPKTLSAYHAEDISFIVARPIQMLMVVLSPLVKGTTLISNYFLRVLFRVKPMSLGISPEEIRSIITYGEEEGVLEKEKKEMLHGVFDISKTIVKEIMIPRPDIIAIDDQDSNDQILKTILDTGHSRYPVFVDQIDNIIGFLFVKDLIPYWSNPEGFDLRKVLRKPSYVPETKRVDQLLDEFRKEKRQISIVADEYGGVTGLVTMEDLLEEITGEIHDEYDLEPRKIERLAKGSMILDGSLTIDEVYEETGMKFPEGEYETLAGFLLDIFGKIPRESEVISFGQYLISAHKLDRHRIVKVKIKPLQGSSHL
jgi:CBS domain containing-hemolysin-like protein